MADKPSAGKARHIREAIKWLPAVTEYLVAGNAKAAAFAAREMLAHLDREASQ